MVYGLLLLSKRKKNLEKKRSVNVTERPAVAATYNIGLRVTGNPANKALEQTGGLLASYCSAG